MSTSLLLALLGAQEANEADYTGKYYTWIGSKWDGKSWVGGNPEKKAVVLRVLYDILHSTISVRMPESGALGTVLSRAISEEKITSLLEEAKPYRTALRAELRTAMIRYINALS